VAIAEECNFEIEKIFNSNSKIFNVRDNKLIDLNSVISASNIARYEITNELQTGKTVVISQQSAIETLISLFGAWAAHCTAVLVNADISADEQARVLKATGAVKWIGDLEAGAQSALEANRSSNKTVETAQPSLVLMTSGTAGEPKGVHLSLSAIVERVRLNRAQMSDAEMHNSLCVLPAFFGHGLVGNCLTPLMAGATLHLLDRPSIAEISKFGSVIDDHEISFMSSVPSFWKIVQKLSPKPLKNTLKRIHVGSAPLTAREAQAVAKWSGTREIYNMYGMTEAANWISGGHALTKTDGDTHTTNADGFVGKPWGGQFAVLQDDGEIATHGRGEVLLQSPSLMEGYWKLQNKTNEAFIDGWFKTGDIGELDANNNLRLVGRMKWEINRAGMKIQAEEVDAVLERHPDVMEACAFGVPDAVSGETVAAVIVLHANTQTSSNDVRAWCSNQVRRDVVPIWVVELDNLPKNDRGKLDRLRTKERALQLRDGSAESQP